MGWLNNDTLRGGAGIDHLYGLDDDNLYGDGGLDRFYFTPDFGNDTIHDYVLGATKAGGEPIHLCMGGPSSRISYSTAPTQDGTGTDITVTFNGVTTGTITLAGINADKDDLNVLISPISGEKCAGLLKLSDEFPAELFWSATLNVADLGDVNSVRSYGCRGEMPAQTCSLATATPSGWGVLITRSTSSTGGLGSLSIGLDQRLPAANSVEELQIDDRRLAWADLPRASSTQGSWDVPDLNWSAGQRVVLKLWGGGASLPLAPAATPPPEVPVGEDTRGPHPQVSRSGDPTPDGIGARWRGRCRRISMNSRY